MRPQVLLCPVLLFACTDRPLDESSSAGTSTSDTSTTSDISTTSDPASSTTPTSTTTATSDPASSTAPTDPATSDPATGSSSTGTTDIDTTHGSSGTTGEMPDLWPDGLVGCALDAPPGTDISGQTMLGPFVGDRAYFGAVGLHDDFYGDLYSPHLVILSPEADAALELQQREGTSGALVLIEPQLAHYDAWLGDWSTSATAVDHMTYSFPAITITITEFAGNWDVPDPADPPRLIGSLAGDLTGKFDAVYCDKADIDIIPD